MFSEFGSKLVNLFKTSLLSYGHVAFVSHPIPALLVLLATFYHPLIGLAGLAGSLVSNATARWMGADDATWKSGILGTNGLLTGLALAMYTTPDLQMAAFLFIGAAAVGVISNFLGSALGKHDLPILSMPMMIIIWPLLISTGLDPILSKAYPAIPFLRSIDIWLFQVLPLSVFEFVKMFGNILFQENLISGVLVLIAIGLISRISLIYALGGGLLGMVTYFALNHTLDGFHGLNFVLVALAFGGYFIISNKHAIIFAMLAIITVGIVDHAAYQFLNPPDTLSISNRPSAILGMTKSTIPTLVFAFNAVTLIFLFPLKIAFQGDRTPRIISVPLSLIKTPESNLIWARRWMSNRYIQKTLLSFPFLGQWSVLQGNNGEWTHKDKGRFAWDFVIKDENGKQFRNDGLELEDYYCYGLPVLAPATGTVASIENSVADNPPGKAETERNWGNYVIIDHGFGEYSEISHFKQASIQVVPGQTVQRGQLIGYCGNSGRSPVPHIHFQLQNEPKVGSQSLGVRFSEGIVNGNISVNIIPKKEDLLAPLQLEASSEFSLIGKETEVWELESRVGWRKFKERLTFTTDTYGLPAIKDNYNHLWYILDKPNFVQITPDFKTFPTMLQPSAFMHLVGESLILPRKLLDGFKWDQGTVQKLPQSSEIDLRWKIISGKQQLTIDSTHSLLITGTRINGNVCSFKLSRVTRPDGKQMTAFATEE